MFWFQSTLIQSLFLQSLINSFILSSLLFNEGSKAAVMKKKSYFSLEWSGGAVEGRSALITHKEDKLTLREQEMREERIV